jgi:hypothetical protein
MRAKFIHDLQLNCRATERQMPAPPRGNQECHTAP